MQKIKITCYGRTEEWSDRNKAMAFYSQAIAETEGSERERYTNIYIGLMEGETNIRDLDY